MEFGFIFWHAFSQSFFLLINFRFCIALEEMDNKDIPMALVLGCGVPQLVRQRAEYITVASLPVTTPPARPAFR